MNRPFPYFVAAPLLLTAGCTLAVPAAPDQRVALPQPCAAGQIPIQADAGWSCGDPGALHTSATVESADQASFADTASYAEVADVSATAETAQGMTPTAHLTLGGPPVGNDSAALQVSGAAMVLGHPVRFLVHGYTLTDWLALGTAYPGNPAAGTYTTTFLLPPRPATTHRPADVYALRVRVWGSLVGGGDPAAGEFTTCKLEVALDPGGGASPYPAVAAETSTYGHPATWGGMAVFGADELTVPAGTYQVAVTLTVVGGVGTGQQCLANNTVGVAIEGS